MSEISVTCYCGKVLTVPASALGKRGKCPSCGATIRLERSSADSRQPAPESQDRGPSAVGMGRARGKLTLGGLALVLLAVVLLGLFSGEPQGKARGAATANDETIPEPPEGEIQPEADEETLLAEWSRRLSQSKGNMAQSGLFKKDLNDPEDRASALQEIRGELSKERATRLGYVEPNDVTWDFSRNEVAALRKHEDLRLSGAVSRVSAGGETIVADGGAYELDLPYVAMWSRAGTTDVYCFFEDPEMLSEVEAGDWLYVRGRAKAFFKDAVLPGASSVRGLVVVDQCWIPTHAQYLRGE